jgi:phthiocerol/phenolphthiocerol synthesis type-I polyketide synthase A
MRVNIRDEPDLRHWLVEYFVTTIGGSGDEIDLDATLNELGMGSRDAVVLAGELSELLGRSVSPLDFWEQPTINALSSHLMAPEQQAEPDTVDHGGSPNDPIAVIGLGCRFPGGITGPEALWQFLCEGRSSIGEVPPDRWPQFDDGSPEMAAALARTTRWGSFLAEIDAFDAEFFDISPSEAAKMDPQQRLLLEVAYEALERAGIPPKSLRRSQTGVFVGACLSEYGYLAAKDLSQVDAWTGTGGALSIVANRLSYFLDLRGPSVAVDTACSSSLVAVHLACQSLRTGDSRLAVAGGVNLLLSPVVTRSFDTAEVMSPTGGCHAFDAGADGFVRGEGCGVVVLKRLADAVRDGDPVLAVVRGSAVNQDGHSNGLMAPNPGAQIAVLRAACARAGIDPRDIDYVETHGTGTLLGDPIEARALGTVFGRGRADGAPLLLGAVKSNVGHLEAAAGIAGFIKATLAVQRGHIPPNLDFKVPNPLIQFEDMRLKVVAEPTDWPITGRPRRAGVSSFGLGGTNAHVVVEQGGCAEQVGRGPEPVVSTVVVSGKSVDRVRSWAGVLADWMGGDGVSVGLADVAHAVNHHRGSLGCFASVCARDRAGAVAGLRAVAAGQPAPGVVGVHAGRCAPGTVFVFSGQGSQWAGMGRRLLAEEPAFAAAVAGLEPDFVAQTGFSLQQTLTCGDEVAGIERIQPVLVGVQLALAALWRSYGVTPDAVIGHSMGEVSAAVVAGALSMADGLKVIATRSRLLSGLSGQGAMALVELHAQATAELIAGYPQLSVAVYASPRQTVIAGPAPQIDAVIAMVESQGRLARRIEVDVASHHRMVDPVLGPLRAALADVSPRAGSIPLISTTVEHPGEIAPVCDADYWAANLRNPVRFAQAITAAGAHHARFIEVSPHPLLTYAISENLTGVHHHAIATLARDTDDTTSFHTNLNAAHTTTPPPTPHPPEPHPAIPTTPWHHTHHWITPPNTAKASVSAPRAGTLLGEHITVSSTPHSHLWQARLLPEAKPYPGCHRIHGVEVVPVSVILQTILCAAAELDTVALSDLRLHHAVVVDHAKVIQVVADRESITVASSSTGDAPWLMHASARPDPFWAPPETPAAAAHERVRDEPGSVAELLKIWGIDGPPFPWSIDSYTSTPTEVVADVCLEEPSTVALVDAAVHVAAMMGLTGSRLVVPAAIDHVRLEHALTERRGAVWVRRVGGDDGDLVVDVTVRAADGTTCLSMRSLRYAPQGPGVEVPRRQESDPRTFAHAIEWRPVQDHRDALVASSGSSTVAMVGADDVALRNRLQDLGYATGGLADARYVVYVPDAQSTNTVENIADCAARMSSDVSVVVRTLAARDEHNPVTLWIVTRGVYEAVDADALRQSPLWGLSAVIGAEHPGLWGGLVDIPHGGDVCAYASALAGLLPQPSRSILLLRDGVILAPALVPLSGQRVRPPLRCRPDAAYLITGGMGALGGLMAAWLADHGARRLILMGRTPLPPRRDWDSDMLDTEVRTKTTAIRALERRGVSIHIAAIDAGSHDDIMALLAERDRDGEPPVRGVIHAAGVTHDELLANATEGSLREVMWPKIAGAQALHDAFPPGSLDFFYLTASAATVFGIPGQSSYAAANAYLDALARSRHRQGCHTVSLDWAAWQGLGFAVDAPLVARELERLGSRELTPQEAFTAWEHVHSYGGAQAVVIPVAVSDAEVRSSTQAHVWSEMSGDDRRRGIQDGLRAILGRELTMPEAEIHSDLPFVEMGLNSMMAMSIRREAEQLVGIELSTTMLWKYPTITTLAAYLAKKLSPQGQAEESDAPSDSTNGVLNDLFDRIEGSSS